MTGIARFSLMGMVLEDSLALSKDCNCFITSDPFLIGKMNLIEYPVVY
jgi:hypothetical protein